MTLDNLSPEETVSELIRMFVPTSRALQIEPKSGRAITNTNYWMNNVLQNCLNYATGIIGYTHGDDHLRWSETIILLNKRKEIHIQEPHDKSMKLTTPENRHGTEL